MKPNISPARCESTGVTKAQIKGARLTPSTSERAPSPSVRQTLSESKHPNRVIPSVALALCSYHLHDDFFSITSV